MGHVGGKDIAQTAQGFNQRRLMRVELNFAPQAHDQHINGPVEYLGAFIMSQRQQLFAIQYPARVLRQRQQQAIFSLGQRDRLLLRVIQFTARGIQPPAVKRQASTAPDASPASAPLRRSTAFTRATTTRELNGLAM